MRKHSLVALVFVIGFFAVGSVRTTAAERKVVAPAGTDLGLPFSPAILSGDFLYIAGAIGNRPGTTEVPRGIQEQVKQTMSNIQSVLEAADMDFSHVVSANVFLSDARHFQAMNEVYQSYFGEAPPTRATVQAAIAIPEALVEISMVAARPGVTRKVVSPAGMSSATLPYSVGIQAGGTLFLAGLTSRDPATREIVGEGDVGAQTKQIFQNMGQVLEAAGMDYGDLASCKVFLADARHFQAMNEAYRSFFEKDPPARATVQAALMNPAFDVEIQCLAVDGQDRHVVVGEGASLPTSPFSPAIRVADRLYTAGMLGRAPEGWGDIKSQTRRSLENLRATLQTAGMDFTNVVEAQVFVTDMRHYAAMNEVYREMLGLPFPARATVGAALMAPEALVEIMMTATK